jgi:DNA-directed RNA polymerase specialized sigma24 family protein
MEWEDVAQELRLHLFLKYRNRKSAIRNYENWAYITCRNKIRDLARYYTRKKRHTNIVSIDELKEKGFDIEG